MIRSANNTPGSARTLVLAVLILAANSIVMGQGGNHSVYGDISVDESQTPGMKPISLDLVLYSESRVIISRLSVPSNGRYRFNNLATGFYDLVVELEGREIARVRVDLSSPLLGDRRQDLALEWKAIAPTRNKAAFISAADKYNRSPANAKLFEKASDATDKKRYDEAADLLQSIVKSDPKDFQAWTALADVHLLQSKYTEAETEYLRAIDLHPGFFPALLNLGRAEVAQQKYDVAIEVLSRALKAHPDSPDANYFLGESYLQIKKGSMAVGYLNEAIRLDPDGMADVHLRLATLYNAAGMKDKAALEYEAFLKKRPDYKDRKKLEDYISTNKRP